MPELPEAETIARGLDERVRGATILHVKVRSPKNVIAPARLNFARAVAGEKIESVTRRGKYVVLVLVSGRRIAIGLRMTGRILVGTPGEHAPPGTHVVLGLSGGRTLTFADVRTFGRMRLVERAEQWDSMLGLEPLDEGFTVEAFTAMLAGRKTPVKVLLLNQRRIAGIGNIYACEALWRAGVRPSRPSGSLSRTAARKLHESIVDVLRQAIASRGSSIDDYVDVNGLQGEFQDMLSVYGLEGSACPRCGKSIVRTVLGQRGTWWCRTCQK